MIERLNSDDDIIEVISEHGYDNSNLFLMANNDWMKAYECISEHSADEYKTLVLNALDDVISTHHEMWLFVDYYCENIGSIEERFISFHTIDESFTDVTVQEIISARKPGRELFLCPNESDYSFPYTHMYCFTKLKNSVQFIFSEYDAVYFKLFQVQLLLQLFYSKDKKADMVL